MTKQPLSILPKTRGGWWSVGLIIIMPVLFIIGASFTNSLYETVPSGDTLFEDIAARPALALTMLAGMAAGISAFLIGLQTIIRKKENAILVYIATVIGALLLVFLTGEIVSPQ